MSDSRENDSHQYALVAQVRLAGRTYDGFGILVPIALTASNENDWHRIGTDWAPSRRTALEPLLVEECVSLAGLEAAEPGDFQSHTETTENRAQSNSVGCVRAARVTYGLFPYRPVALYRQNDLQLVTGLFFAGTASGLGLGAFVYDWSVRQVSGGDTSGADSFVGSNFDAPDKANSSRTPGTALRESDRPASFGGLPAGDIAPAGASLMPAQLMVLPVIHAMSGVLPPTAPVAFRMVAMNETLDAGWEHTGAPVDTETTVIGMVDLAYLLAADFEDDPGQGGV